MEYVSQREFAKHIGRSHVWVNRLVKEGKIPSNDKGRIPLQDGLRAYEASQQPGYDANRAHGEKQRRAAKKTTRKTAAKKSAASKTLPVQTLPDDDDDAPLPSSGFVPVEKINAAYNKARLAEKTFQAKLKELEYQEAKGQLIPIDVVKSDAAHAGTEIREKLSSIGARIASICEGKTAREIEGIIDDAINEALEALHKTRFGKG